MAVGVYYYSILVFGTPYIAMIIKVNMTVDQIPGPEDAHKPQKDFKAPVTGVLLVVDAPGGGVGKEQIQKTAPENTVDDQSGEQPDNLHQHSKFGVLILSPVIHHGTPQPRNDQPLLPSYPGSYMDSPCAWQGLIIVPQGITVGTDKAMEPLEVMITENEEERLVKAGNDEFQVIQGQVAGAENQVHVGKTFLNRSGVYQRIDLIRYAENLHGRRLASLSSTCCSIP
jgi:hypothetical protein